MQSRLKCSPDIHVVLTCKDIASWFQVFPGTGSRRVQQSESKNYDLAPWVPTPNPKPQIERGHPASRNPHLNVRQRALAVRFICELTRIPDLVY